MLKRSLGAILSLLQLVVVRINEKEVLPRLHHKLFEHPRSNETISTLEDRRVRAESLAGIAEDAVNNSVPVDMKKTTAG